MEVFSRRLKELRIERGLSLTTLAKVLDINHSTLLRWERGEMAPSIIHLYNLATYFGVTSDYLIGLED